jgi:lipopolysaccharide biosynthesis regulator YciM
MRVHVRFSELKTRRKLKELGKFFEQNHEFVIEIDSRLDSDQKVLAFAEEMIHFLVRIVSHRLGKKIKVLSEESLAKMIVDLIFTSLTNTDRGSAGIK